MGSGGSTLTLLTGGELSEVTVVVTLPIIEQKIHGQLLDTKIDGIANFQKKHA